MIHKIRISFVGGEKKPMSSPKPATVGDPELVALKDPKPNSWLISTLPLEITTFGHSLNSKTSTNRTYGYVNVLQIVSA